SWNSAIWAAESFMGAPPRRLVQRDDESRSESPGLPAAAQWVWTLASRLRILTISGPRWRRGTGGPVSAIPEGRRKMRDIVRRSLVAWQPSRRTFLAGSGAAVGAAALGALRAEQARAADNVLSLLSWPGHAAPEVVGPFEQQTGAKVQAKEYTGG